MIHLSQECESYILGFLGQDKILLGFFASLDRHFWKIIIIFMLNEHIEWIEDPYY